MRRIEAARLAVLEWSRNVLSLRGRAAEAAFRVGHDGTDFADTVVGETGLVMNPAQSPAFFARSTTWRCTGCGKTHLFTQMVSVASASPCSCTSIEFEPQRDLVFANVALPGRARLAG